MSWRGGASTSQVMRILTTSLVPLLLSQLTCVHTVQTVHYIIVNNKKSRLELIAMLMFVWVPC